MKMLNLLNIYKHTHGKVPRAGTLGANASLKRKANLNREHKDDSMVKKKYNIKNIP